MDITRSQLEEFFRELSDDELLQRCAKDLTDLARDVALAEAANRRLQVPGLGDCEELEDLTTAQGQGPLRICTRFILPLDAQLFAARLQADGVAARVMDADTVYANGALFGSLLLGGVRVMVPESQLEEANRILAKFNAGEYAIDENFDVDE
jgi:hypothetical protein